MSATIEQIADRANLLTASVDHGHACYIACREAGVPDNEIAMTASVVSTVLIRRELNTPMSTDAAAIMKREEAEKNARLEFVKIWAAKLGKVGRKWKQSRQAHVRKLAKHGLNSEYARKMAAEAGITL